MTEVNQNNLRSLLPEKESRVIQMIKQKHSVSLKEAYLRFYSSDVYKKLENEQTKCWWLSAAQLFEDANEFTAMNDNIDKIK